MKPILVALAVVAIFAAATSAFADNFPTVTFDGGPANQVIGSWTVNWVWSANDWHKDGGVARLDLTLDWNLPGDSANDFMIGGYNSSDPIVSELTRNFSFATWTDWHVTVHNGIIRQDGSADFHKVGSANKWSIQYGTVSDGTTITGFTTDTNEFVGRNSRLSIYFVYDPIDVGQPIVIQEAPSSDFVPEPAAVSGLLAGLGMLGMLIRRSGR
jgi:opacity protein-like surface antigen